MKYYLVFFIFIVFFKFFRIFFKIFNLKFYKINKNIWLFKKLNIKKNKNKKFLLKNYIYLNLNLNKKLNKNKMVVKSLNNFLPLKYKFFFSTWWTLKRIIKKKNYRKFKRKLKIKKFLHFRRKWFLFNKSKGKIFRWFFFFKDHLKVSFIKKKNFFLKLLKIKNNFYWFIKNFNFYNIYFLIDFFFNIKNYKLSLILDKKSKIKHKRVNIFFSLFFKKKRKIFNYNIKFKYLKLSLFLSYFIFILDFYFFNFLKNTFFKKLEKLIILKLLFYFFSLYSFFLSYFFFLINFNFLKFFFFLINFFFKQLIYFNRLFLIFKVTYLKFRFKENFTFSKLILNLLKKNFFYKKKFFFNFFNTFNLFKNRYNIKNLNIKSLEYFFYYFLLDYKRFNYFFFFILNLLKFYKKKKLFLNIIFKHKGIFFSKFYRKDKFITFPPKINFWKKFNFFILKNLLKRFRNINFKFSFYNSSILKRYFVSYFNYKNIKNFHNSKVIIKKKFNFRLRNFFFFFELRITNLLKRLGFKKNLHFFKNYESFFLFNKFSKFSLFLKNKNYILKKNDLIVLNYKYYYFNKFYYYFYNSFLEVNYNIKSFYLVRLPFLNEIIKKWSNKIFNFNLYKLIYK